MYNMYTKYDILSYIYIYRKVKVKSKVKFELTL